MSGISFQGPNICSKDLISHLNIHWSNWTIWEAIVLDKLHKFCITWPPNGEMQLPGPLCPLIVVLHAIALFCATAFDTKIFSSFN